MFSLSSYGIPCPILVCRGARTWGLPGLADLGPSRNTFKLLNVNRQLCRQLPGSMFNQQRPPVTGSCLPVSPGHPAPCASQAAPGWFGLVPWALGGCREWGRHQGQVCLDFPLASPILSLPTLDLDKSQIDRLDY